MDMETGKQQFITFLKKYQYVLLVILVGVCLMMMPAKSEQPQMISMPEETAVTDLENELSFILSKIAGVGKTEVLLTEASGSHTIYQMDTGRNREDLQTVIITDKNREEAGLVKQIVPPDYKGALVVCEGGDSANVRLAVVDAVKSVTGLSADCITVLKMK